MGHWAAVSAPARIDALIRSIAHCTFDMCLAGVTAGGRTSDRPIGLGEEVLNWVHRERAKSNGRWITGSSLVCVKNPAVIN